MIVNNIKFHWQYEGKSVICIVTAPDGKIINAASAHTSAKDQYCRETGRRVSLTRALRSASSYLFPDDPVPGKLWRAAVWETYRKMTKVPRWNTASDLQEAVQALRTHRN